MSATNTTTNYNLPIFIGTDKPAWLVDFNGAMNAIDAQMKVNADAIALKSPILTFNDTTEIDFTVTSNTVTASLASGVSDKVGRALVTPIAAPAAEQIVAINTSGTQDVIEIGSGLFNDSGTLKAVDLNLTDTGICSTITVASGSGISVGGSAIRYALNADKSIGKIYGYVDISGSGTGAFQLNIGLNIPNDTEYTINAAGITAGASGIPGTGEILVQSNGNVRLTGYKGSSAGMRMIFWPCLYFFTNFGDTPTP